MKYVCLVYLEQHALDALSKAEMAALDQKSIAYDDELRATGHLIAAEALQHARTAQTLKVRKDQVTRADGPFAETKEHLGGFILINALNFETALQIAEKIPIAQLGTIEVRPIYEIPQSA